MTLVVYFHGDNILLERAKAKRIAPEDLHRIYNIVEELKISSGLEETPSIYVIDDPALEAFSVGRDPKKSAIVMTYGLLTRLNRDELQGVIGHEIAHIKNRDVLLMTMCSVLLGSMIILSHYPSYMSWSQTVVTVQEPSKKQYSDRKNLRTAFTSIFLGWIVILALPFGSSVSLAFLIAFAILSLILTPLTVGILIGLPFAVLLIYYAISRKREYLADACAAVYTRYPEGLASALEKIASFTEQLQSATQATAPIYVANPFGKHGTERNKITDTHPPIMERIRILRLMTHISFADYNSAYKEVHGTHKTILPTYMLANADRIAMLAATADDVDYVQQVRETSAALWNASNYKTVTCACGTRLRLPPTYKQSEIQCPHCGRINPV